MRNFSFSEVKLEKPNIILITIDALRFDHLGCYGYPRNTSPNIDSLASKGALFLEAIANGGRTPDSFPSILASQLPPLDYEEYRQVMQRGPTLAGLLRGAGYQTAAFHSNAFLSELFHYNEGFNVFEDDMGTLTRVRRRKDRIFRPTEKRKLPRIFIRFLVIAGNMFNHLRFSLGGRLHFTAEKITGEAVSWLDTCRDSFFLWLHYMDVHYPYLPPSEYARKFCNHHISRHRMSQLYYKQVRNFRSPEQMSPEEMDTLINLYDANIRYVDDNIGRLLDSLGSRLQNTIIIVTADHGEAFGEHNWLGHGTLHDEVVHVPLIIAGAGIKAGTIVKEPVELMDLAPTIVDLVGISSVKGFHGRSLLPVMRGSQRVTEGTIATRQVPELAQRCISYRTPEWKYIRTESLDEASTLLLEELYDLKNDPQERHNRHRSEAEAARAFELEAIAKILEFKQLKSEEKTAYEKERIRAKLKKLPKL